MNSTLFFCRKQLLIKVFEIKLKPEFILSAHENEILFHFRKWDFTVALQ